MSRHIYALYKGEQNLADGTLEEIARKTGKTYKSLKWMTYPSYKRRLQKQSSKIGHLELVDIGGSDDDVEK